MYEFFSNLTNNDTNPNTPPTGPISSPNSTPLLLPRDIALIAVGVLIVAVGLIAFITWYLKNTCHQDPIDDANNTTVAAAQPFSPSDALLVDTSEEDEREKAPLIP